MHFWIAPSSLVGLSRVDREADAITAEVVSGSERLLVDRERLLETVSLPLLRCLVPKMPLLCGSPGLSDVGRLDWAAAAACTRSNNVNCSSMLHVL
jgi:hypothetical protein